MQWKSVSGVQNKIRPHPIDLHGMETNKLTYQNKNDC